MALTYFLSIREKVLKFCLAFLGLINDLPDGVDGEGEDDAGYEHGDGCNPDFINVFGGDISVANRGHGGDSPIE